jgi:hypothetical protein
MESRRPDNSVDSVAMECEVRTAEAAAVAWEDEKVFVDVVIGGDWFFVFARGFRSPDFGWKFDDEGVCNGAGKGKGYRDKGGAFSKRSRAIIYRPNRKSGEGGWG